jgi:hypothetical protein
LEKKILEEHRLKDEAEGKIEFLEQEETEILKRIKQTTQVHKALIEDLEKININDNELLGQIAKNHEISPNKQPVRVVDKGSRTSLNSAKK